MQPMFARMNPLIENMVIEPGPNNTTQILCVECGWEGVSNRFDHQWAFLGHPCRLISLSVSTTD